MNKSTIIAIVSIIIALGAVYYAYMCKTTQLPAEATAIIPAQAHGYLMGSYTVTDQAGYQKYLDGAGSLAAKYNGKIIIFDLNVKKMEGNPKQVMAVAEFPSVAEAERFYNSPEYSAVKGLRIASTDGDFLIVAEGFVPPQQ